MKYTVVLQRTEEGISVGCPGLPGCWSQGATEQESLENIQAAIQMHIQGMQADNQPIPEPQTFAEYVTV